MTRLPFRALRALSLIIAACALAASVALAEDLSPTVSIDNARAELDRIEGRLTASALNDGELDALRQRIDPLTIALDAAVTQLQPQLSAADARLAQIGPKPKEGEPAESADVARERDVQAATRQQIDEAIKRGKLIQVEATQVAAKIAERRRAMLADRLFEGSRSLADPRLWADVVREAPNDLNNVGRLAADVAQTVSRNFGPAQIALAATALLAAAFLLFPGRRWAAGFGERLVIQQAPQSRLRRSMVALVRLLVTTLTPLLATAALYWALKAAGWMPSKFETLAFMVVLASGFIGFTHGIMRALLAPYRPSWRIVDLSDAAIAEMKNQPVWVALGFVAGRLVHHFNEAVGASLPVVIASGGLFALLNAATFAIALRRIRAAERVEATIRSDHGDAFDRPVLLLLRLIAWMAVTASVVSVFVGYVAFAQFLINQVIWIAAVFSLAYLLLMVVDDVLTTGLSAETRVGRSVSGAVGMRPESLEQLGVLLSGAVRIMLIGAAALLVLAPWGLASSDVFGWLRYAITGVQIGDIKVSIPGVLGTLLLVAIGFGVTRLAQRWLDRDLLPKTRMDAGLKASISTGVGYLGGIGVIVLAVTSLGFSLDRLAIVAGALSVGIGFGLQAVISNFVSGVILLAERPIKAGDWIVIGSDEGNVRRISVRSTEIELFDRSTLIVPNSDFITKSVKNVTHGSPVGRVKIDFSVSAAVDPVAVKAVAIETAKANGAILAFPEPQLFLNSFAADQNAFSLFCNVPSPRQAGSVKSDLNFALVKAFAERGVALGGPAGPTVVDAAERIGEILGRFAKSPGLHDASDAPLSAPSPTAATKT
ncbi:DUF3772 domain-containing protein [Hansschlegelia sp. KR7-227]|uniref:DUF3772 domain-containing protein n=1 Tax=Hansschlegelia sp. KR7-227 TaxID=3400914 RepID=UPI003C06CF93